MNLWRIHPKKLNFFLRFFRNFSLKNRLLLEVGIHKHTMWCDINCYKSHWQNVNCNCIIHNAHWHHVTCDARSQHETQWMWSCKHKLHFTWCACDMWTHFTIHIDKWCNVIVDHNVTCDVVNMWKPCHIITSFRVTCDLLLHDTCFCVIMWMQFTWLQIVKTCFYMHVISFYNHICAMWSCERVFTCL